MVERGLDLVAETDRLRIRRFAPGDADFLVRLLNAPGFLRNIGDRGVRTRDDARRYLETGPLESYRVNGFGPFLVELRSSNAPVGMCGLIRKPWLERPDLAYAFLPEAEGRGYASEAARAVVEFGWRTLKLDRLLAVVLPDNAASIRVLEKLEFAPVRTITDPRTGTSLSLCELKRELRGNGD